MEINVTNVDKIFRQARKSLENSKNVTQPVGFYIPAQYKLNPKWKWYKFWVKKYVEVDLHDFFKSNGFL